MRLTTVLVTLMAAPLLRGEAREYCFDSQRGSDRNPGGSAALPFATLGKLAELRLEPGDIVRFRRGSTFRGRLSFRGNGVSGSPIRLTTYGEGAKPEILGSVTLSEWTRHEGEVYKATLPPERFFGKKMVYGIYECADGRVPVRLLREESIPRERGRFCFDPAASTIYAITSDGASPSQHRLEVSVIEQLVELANREWLEIDGLAFLFGNCRHLVAAECRDLTIRDCASLFVGSYGNPNVLIIRNSTRVKLVDCFLYENANCGVFLSSGATECLVSGCTIAKCQSNDGVTCHSGGRDASGKVEGITGDRNVIENNVIGLCPEESIDITSGDYHVIRGNVCYGNGNPGIIVGHDSDHVLIENNVCFANARSGIQIGGNEQEGGRGENRVIRNLVYDNGYPGLEIQGKNTRVLNNTIVNSRERVAVRISEQAAGTELRNNMILTLDPKIPHPSLHFIGCTPTSLGCKLSRNLFFHAADNAKPQVFFPAGQLIRTDDGSFSVDSFLAKYQTGEDSLVAEPKFADVRRYLLTPDSPGVDAGGDVGLPFAGKAPDLGWKELGSEASAPKFPESLIDGKDDEDLILRLWGKQR
jgi:parallel beta-helix repeat protein